MNPIKIIDIIHHKNQYSTQVFVVVDRLPVYLYEKQDCFLIGEDSGFFNFFQYQSPSKHFQAFGGREFDINLKNGSTIKATGQWWDSYPPDYSELNLLYSCGVGAPDNLEKCNVFCSASVDKCIIDDWLEKNEPSNNYQKYNKRDESYMQHTIKSKFD